MRRFSFAALALAMLLAGCASQPTASAPTAAVASNAKIAVASKLIDSGAPSIPDVGQAAPDFEFTMADGTAKKLSDLRGKKVIVNFWATWCEPCREEMPDLDKVQQEYGDSLVILGVNKAESLEQISQFTTELPVSFALVANPDGDISQRYFTRTVPNSYFLNTDGTIGARELKIMDYKTIKSALDSLH